MIAWLWIPAVTLLGLFVLVLCWLFFYDYTCCPCKRKRFHQVDEDTTPSAPPTHENETSSPNHNSKTPSAPLLNYHQTTDAVSRQRYEDGLFTLDLHNMSYDDAIEATMAFITKCRGCFRKVRIITGRGIHARGAPVLKPTVLALLHELQLPFVETHQGGCVEVTLIC